MNEIRLQMQHISSNEFYKYSDTHTRQVLKDITLNVNSQEILGVVGDSAFELRLLFEIIGNARKYKNGLCVLNEVGMIKKKRVNINHVFYIGSTNMCLENMNTLEYLMYIQAKQQHNCIDCQEGTLSFLEECGMGYLALSEIRNMSSCEKVLVTICSALFTSAKLIIVNIARVEYDESAIKVLKKLCLKIQELGHSMVIASFDTVMIDQCATHIGVLNEGIIKQLADKDEFVKKFDGYVCEVGISNAPKLSGVLKSVIKDIVIEEEDSKLIIRMSDKYEKRESIYQEVLKVISDKGFVPNFVVKHDPCVKHAMKGCLK